MTVIKSTDVMIYNDADNEGELFIHEIFLDEDIDSQDEGDEISQELSQRVLTNCNLHLKHSNRSMI